MVYGILEPMHPAGEAQSLNNWTPREDPQKIYLFIVFRSLVELLKFCPYTHTKKKTLNTKSLYSLTHLFSLSSQSLEPSQWLETPL